MLIKSIAICIALAQKDLGSLASESIHLILSMHLILSLIVLFILSTTSFYWGFFVQSFQILFHGIYNTAQMSSIFDPQIRTVHILWFWINYSLIGKISNFTYHMLTYWKFIDKNFITWFLKKLLKIIDVLDLTNDVKQFYVLNTIALQNTKQFIALS